MFEDTTFRGDQNTLRGPFNRCIYCGDDSDIASLNHEHAAPEALGARLVLLKASCPVCKHEIDRFESRCSNQMFAAVRAHLDFNKTKSKGRRRHFPIEVRIADRIEQLRVPIEQHPTTLHLPSFAPPGLVMSQPPAIDFTDVRGWTWHLGEERAFSEKIRKLREATGADEVIIRGRILGRSFGRLLAKMAHCTAIAMFGVAEFVPLLPNIITKEDGPIAFLVGGNTILTVRTTQQQGYEYGFGCARNDVTGHTLLLCTIRLFAWLENTPTYLVVVGEPSSSLMQQLEAPAV